MFTFTGSFFAGSRPSLSANAAPPISAINISIWYDAADPVYFTPTNPSSGTNLNNWNDKSGAARNAGPVGGANKPDYITNEQNGKNIVRFSSQQNMQVTGATWTRSQSAFAVYTVARAASVSGIRTITATDTNGYKISYNGTNWTVSTAGLSGTSTVTGDTTKFHIHGFLFDASGIANNNKFIYRYDLSAIPLTFTGTAASATSNVSSNFDIGWWENGSSPTKEYFTGDVAEVIVFTRKITTPEIDFVENYLKNKWGL